MISLIIVKCLFFSILIYLLIDFFSKSRDRKLQKIIRKKSDYKKFIKKLNIIFSKYFDYEKIELRIKQAGKPFNLTPEIYFLLKLILPILAFLIQLNGKINVFYLGFILVVSFFIPDLFLILVTWDRRKAVLSELPEVVDIFEAGASAGIDLGNVFRLAAEFAGEKELKKELMYLSAEYAVTKDKNKALENFKKNMGLYDTDILVLALLQGDITGKTKNMLEALSLVQSNNIISKIQREAKSIDYKVLLACSMMAFSAAAIYFYPYFSALEAGLFRVFQ